jgi:hypothetical protein
MKTSLVVMAVTKSRYLALDQNTLLHFTEQVIRDSLSEALSSILSVVIKTGYRIPIFCSFGMSRVAEEDNLLT